MKKERKNRLIPKKRRVKIERRGIRTVKRDNKEKD